MYHIRKYNPSDRERLRYICKETAWDSYKKTDNRSETVAIMFNDYFTQYESDNIFVAVDEEDMVFGYIICSSDYDLFIRKNKEEFLPKAKRLYYPITFVHKAVCKALKDIKENEKRAHIHIDLLPPAQHQGLGIQFLETLSDHLCKKGVQYMSVCCVNTEADSYKLCKRFGFETYKKSPFNTETLIIKTKEKSNG